MYNSRPGRNDWTGYNRPNNWDGHKDWDKCHDCEWHNDENDEFCCKNSMRRALELLSNPTVKRCIDFNAFVFIGDSFLAGSALTKNGFNILNDNLGEIFDATFKGFDNCNRDLVNIDATNLFYPIPCLNVCGINKRSLNNHEIKKPLDDYQDQDYDKNYGSISCANFTIPNFNAKNISLCDLEAVAFIADSNIIGPLTRLLDKVSSRCSDESCECCCNNGIFNKVFNQNSPNMVNLTAGWLAVKDATVLGRVGNVLVLSNPACDCSTIYFVCLDSVGFIG